MISDLFLLLLFTVLNHKFSLSNGLSSSDSRVKQLTHLKALNVYERANRVAAA